MNVPKQILEEENLETPQQSVKFLEYYQKHVEKVDKAREKLHSFSKFLMMSSVVALGFMAYQYFTPAQTPRNYGKPRLGAANVEAETDEMSGMFNGVSVFIWGLVLAKARSGMDAASQKDTGTVGGLLKRSAGLIFMIAIASVFQLLSVYKSEMVPSAEQVAKHALMAAHEAENTGSHNFVSENMRNGVEPKPKLEAGHSESYYDEKSPHYMGGAHNVALARLSAKTSKSQENTHEMRLQAARKKQENIERFTEMFFSPKGLFTLGAFLVSISFGIAFYVHF